MFCTTWIIESFVWYSESEVRIKYMRLGGEFAGDALLSKFDAYILFEQRAVGLFTSKNKPQIKQLIGI